MVELAVGRGVGQRSTQFRGASPRAATVSAASVPAALLRRSAGASGRCCLQVDYSPWLFRRAAQAKRRVDFDLDIQNVDYAVPIQIIDGGCDAEGLINDSLHVGRTR